MDRVQEERNLLKLQNEQYRSIIATQKEVIHQLHQSVRQEHLRSTGSHRRESPFRSIKVLEKYQASQYRSSSAREPESSTTSAISTLRDEPPEEQFNYRSTQPPRHNRKSSQKNEITSAEHSLMQASLKSKARAVSLEQCKLLSKNLGAMRRGIKLN